jgi:hypothetical protein
MRLQALKLTIAATAALVTTVASAQQESLSQILTPLSVIDSRGQIVGQLISPSTIARKFNNIWIIYTVTANGFAPADSTDFSFIHTSTNCSGSRYMLAEKLPANGLVDVTDAPTTLYMPAPPIQLFKIGSIESFASNDSIAHPGRYCTALLNPHYVGRVATVPLSTLGLVPPFSVKSGSGR